MKIKLSFPVIWIICLCIMLWSTSACSNADIIPVKSIENETFGCESNPAGKPIGGVAGYIDGISKIDYRVATYDELQDALKRARAGEIIYIADNVEIDFTDKKTILIPEGVVIKSGRGSGGSKGAMLFSNNLGALLFRTNGDNIRISGFRLRGPDPERRTEQMRRLDKEGKYYSIPNSNGIISSHKGLVIEKCEISGWSFGGVHLEKGAKAHIHHNYFHHNQREGLGYGIVLYTAEALIEANIFDWNRHAIAGSGSPGTSYEARYNLILENGNSHSFDMHGGRNRKDGTDIAGDVIRIHHNTFKGVGIKAIMISGRPQKNAEIHHNWFFSSANPKSAIEQRGSSENMKVYLNIYSPSRNLMD
jgi:hypothetical protein